MTDSENFQLITSLLPVARQAGQAIMKVYHQGVESQHKKDGSPVTEADCLAEAIILAGLADVAADVTVISEENAESHSIEAPDRFFLVDPLDGTREFIRADGKGAFTVNIALVEHGVPVAGVIYAPAIDELYWGGRGQGAFLNDGQISTRTPDPRKIVALASRSHRDQQTKQWLADNNISETVSIGSSLKFCLVARGQADIYPRFGPTMEWDTAAGHAILCAAGGKVEKPDGGEFTYGKSGYKNGAFIARGSL